MIINTPKYFFILCLLLNLIYRCNKTRFIRIDIRGKKNIGISIQTRYNLFHIFSFSITLKNSSLLTGFEK